MGRKVIQIADSTQLISIPRAWGRKYNIKKGDELEVVEKDNMLEISTKREDTLQEITLDITDLDRTSIFIVLRAAYRRGYDVIKVNFKNKTAVHYRTGEKVLVATLLHEELRRWVGMQIIEQKENYFVYKSISKPSFEELESMLRRTFLLLMDACDEFVKACENDDKVLLETMDQKFFNILIFIAYCERLLNRIGYPEKYKNILLYAILMNLNKIGDVLRYAAREVLTMKKVHPKTMGILREIFGTVRVYYDLFYKFDYHKATTIYKVRDALIKEIAQVKKTISPEELMLVVYCRSVLEILVHNIEATITYALQEQEKKEIVK